MMQTKTSVFLQLASADEGQVFSLGQSDLSPKESMERAAEIANALDTLSSWIEGITYDVQLHLQDSYTAD